MSVYRSPLHPPLFPSQISSYSSLTGALTTKPTKQFDNPRRRRVPQYKSRVPAGGVPLCPPILFDYFKAHGQGVPANDFIVLSANALAQEVSGANDQTLTGLDIDHLNLRIMWQGYEGLNWTHSVPVSSAISRVQLGARIALLFWDFVRDIRNSGIPRPEWMQDFDSMINFEQIILLGLYNIYDDIWQVDVAVDTPLFSSS